MVSRRDLSERDFRRRDPRTEEPDGSLIGYSPDAGSGAKAFPGDDQFPFVKDPPSVEQTVCLWNRHSLGNEPRDLFPSPVVDVTNYRIFNLTVRFYPAVVAGGSPSQITMAIVPEAGLILPPQMHVGNEPSHHLGVGADASDAENILWGPVGVVDPVIRGAYPSAPGDAVSLDPPCMGYRDMYASQFNLTGNTSVDAATMTPCLTNLAFDVTPYKLFRIKSTTYSPISGAAAPPSGSFADLFYNLER
jgi:hypothetical protein